MTSPKPTPPKDAVDIPQVKEKKSPKKPYVMRPHLTDRPFNRNEALHALRAELTTKSNTRKSKKVGR